ncbi:unnamed protein product [Lactuca saligna]|uniref:Uncharacterized protein n=1 Tax=Lactuca saligna TaxID=75948 RepID=A0AA35ZRN5_LACSI|nr:unnamed protein product [Lactuca saligna]
MQQSLDDADKLAIRGKRSNPNKATQGGPSSKAAASKKRKSEKAATPIKKSAMLRRQQGNQSLHQPAILITTLQINPVMTPMMMGLNKFLLLLREVIRLLFLLLMRYHSMLRFHLLKLWFQLLLPHVERLYLLLHHPYRIQSDDNDDAPVTKRHLKDLNDKLDTLIDSSSTFSSAYSEATVKSILETVLQRHESSIQNAKDDVDASTMSSKKVVDAVKSLVHDARIFLESLQGASETNSNKVNATIESLSKTFQDEQAKFDQVRSGLQADQTSFQSSVASRLEKLQEELSFENRVMDELDRQTTMIKTQIVHLNQARRDIDELNRNATLEGCFHEHESVIDAHKVLNAMFLLGLTTKAETLFGMLLKQVELTCLHLSLVNIFSSPKATEESKQIGIKADWRGLISCVYSTPLINLLVFSVGEGSPQATVKGWLWDVLLQPVKSKGPLLNEDTIDHIKTIISQKGSDAWWYMKVKEFLPEKYRDKASDYVQGTDTMDVWFDSGGSDGIANTKSV